MLRSALHPEEAAISSFDTAIDNLGFREGYGDGDYTIYPAHDSLFFGEDFAFLLAYFNERRIPGQLNKKSDVSPQELKQFLPWISIIEPCFEGEGRVCDARVTLHGSAVAAAYSDNTGKLVSEVHAPHVAGRITASMQVSADKQMPVIGVSDERRVLPHVRLTILYLPLSNLTSRLTHFFTFVRLDKLD